jgi:cytochrome c
MGMKLTGFVAFAVAIGAAHSAQAQDVAAGERSFLKCKPCHQVGTDAINSVGPVLNGVIGRKAGTMENYSYSAANKDSGLIWNEATFRDYIKNPRAKVPGTKMAFAGVTNENEITNLFAYLSQFDDKGDKK